MLDFQLSDASRVTCFHSFAPGKFDLDYRMHNAKSLHVHMTDEQTKDGATFNSFHSSWYYRQDCTIVHIRALHM